MKLWDVLTTFRDFRLNLTCIKTGRVLSQRSTMELTSMSGRILLPLFALLSHYALSASAHGSLYDGNKRTLRKARPVGFLIRYRNEVEETVYLSLFTGAVWCANFPRCTPIPPFAILWVATVRTPAFKIIRFKTTKLSLPIYFTSTCTVAISVIYSWFWW